MKVFRATFLFIITAMLWSFSVEFSLHKRQMFRYNSGFQRNLELRPPLKLHSLTRFMPIHTAPSAALQSVQQGVTEVARGSFTKALMPHLALSLSFQFGHSLLFRSAHRLQTVLWKLWKIGTPLPWNESILGFLDSRSNVLGRIILLNLFVSIVCKSLPFAGVNLRVDSSAIVSKVSLVVFTANLIELFVAKFLPVIAPRLADSRRQSYVVRRAISVLLWLTVFLVLFEAVSTYLQIPLTSILAFGGVGGLALGLSTRDIVGNFLGGMLLLINEPFTPGDLIAFKTGSSEIEGRVERVGWNQIRIRGRDTRPIYIPNSQFVNTAVTNMERITHKKFEKRITLQLIDTSRINQIIAALKDKLRGIPKVDLLSQPFRVHFTEISNTSVVIDITLFFATKNVDDYLNLQQMANLEILNVLEDFNAPLASRNTCCHSAPGLLPST